MTRLESAMRVDVVIACIAAILCDPAAAGRQLPPPAGALETLVETGSAPEWVALPVHGQLEMPYGMKFEMMHAVVVSRSKPREAVLVGALRNRGESAAKIGVELRYFDVNGEMLRPVARNEAGVSWAPAGALLPFRFALARRDQMSGRAVIYRLVVFEEAAGAPYRLESVRVEVTRARSLGRGRGVSVAGLVEFGSDPAPHVPEDLVVTLLLLDGEGRVLDVAAERPFHTAHTPAAGPWPFEIRTTMPLSKPLRDVRAWVAEAERKRQVDRAGVQVSAQPIPRMLWRDDAFNPAGVRDRFRSSVSCLPAFRPAAAVP